MSDKDLYVLHGGEEINYSLGRRKYKVYMAEQWEGEHGYAPKNHDHDDEYSKLGHTHTGIGDIPAHNHDTVYSKLGHNHDSVYSKIGHSHAGFASTYHDHDATYSKLGHVHDYAASNHNHDDRYSLLNHSHELIDMLPVGTVLWFGQDVTLSNKWTICTDLIGRYPLGATSGIGNTVEAGLPNITGQFSAFNNSLSDRGAFYVTSTGGARYDPWQDDGDTYGRVNGFDASQCSSVYKDDCTTVTPASMKLIPYIKIA